MLYRFRPSGHSDWIDSISRNDFDLLDEYNAELDKLEWKPAERLLDTETLRLALRHGRASATGLVVDPYDLVPLDHLLRMVDSQSELIALRPEYRKTLERLEVVYPGRLDEEDRQNRELDSLIAKSVKKAQRELDQALEAAPISALVSHWASLGGALPDPL